ncbi:unnamed protein product, partial [Gongylonema pulchrum]|uniref:RNase NYN domain-containing protein n=1 Tax=Gongylonema pulchrum TaxID=637853 RepID=A0A183EM94_9BILA
MPILQRKQFGTVYLHNKSSSIPEQLEYPGRNESLARAVTLLHELATGGANPIVVLVPELGFEKFLADVAKQLQCKVWVDRVRREIVKILGLEEYFTDKQTDTSIWACNDHNQRVHHIKYWDESSRFEVYNFLSYLSFSRIVPLAPHLPPEQAETTDGAGDGDEEDWDMCNSSGVESWAESTFDKSLESVFACNEMLDVQEQSLSDEQILNIVTAEDEDTRSMENPEELPSGETTDNSCIILEMDSGPNDGSHHGGACGDVFDKAARTADNPERQNFTEFCDIVSNCGEHASGQESSSQMDESLEILGASDEDSQSTTDTEILNFSDEESQNVSEIAIEDIS